MRGNREAETPKADYPSSPRVVGQPFRVAYSFSKAKALPYIRGFKGAKPLCLVMS